MPMRAKLTALLSRRPPRVYLHIGAMKTGTTYLQHLMEDNRETLLRAGVLFPGARWVEQSLAVRDVLGGTAGLGDQEDDEADARPSRGMWRSMVDEIQAHDGTSTVVSMEFLSYADEEKAARIVESFPGKEVHVVLTVRDAAQSVPAQWQTSCRMAGTAPLGAVVKAMAKGPSPTGEPGGQAARLLQRTQGIPRMLDVWVPLVGADHVHVVTVPPRGSDPVLLWRRFAEVVGIDADSCVPPTSYVHTSLGMVSTELLRLLNVELGRSVARSDQGRTVKRELVQALHGRSADEGSIRLNLRGRRLARRWNRAVRRAIRAHGVDVVGDLDDLDTSPVDPATPVELQAPSEQQLLDAAVVARARLLGYRQELRERAGGAAAAASAAASAASAGDVATAAGAASSEDGPGSLGGALKELGDLARECIDLLVELKAPHPGLVRGRT
jgi:hypothetical protein